MAQPDGEQLLREGAPTPRLVFVLDSPVPRECRSVIKRWVKQQKPPVDIDIMSPSESRATEYRRDRLPQKTVARNTFRVMTLDNVLDSASHDLFRRGGKLVFVRESTFPPASTTLVALSRAARRVPLEYVSLAPVDEASLAPDLNPALLKQIQDGGGRFRWLPTRQHLAKFLRSRDLVPWGVHGTVKVILSPSVHVTRASGLGVRWVVSDDNKHTQLTIATLTDYTPVTLELKVDAEERPRLSEPEDSRLFVQVQLTYTDLSGRSLLRVYNRAFTKTGQERLTLSY